MNTKEPVSYYSPLTAEDRTVLAKAGVPLPDGADKNDPLYLITVQNSCGCCATISVWDEEQVTKAKVNYAIPFLPRPMRS